MPSRKTYLILSIIAFVLAATRIFVSIAAGDFSWTEPLIYGSFVFMLFAITYLHPQLIQKDERMQYIRQKTMQYSLIAIMIYLILLSLNTVGGVVPLTAFEMLSLLVGMTMITIWSVWIYMAKTN